MKQEPKSAGASTERKEERWIRNYKDLEQKLQRPGAVTERKWSRKQSATVWVT
jgi:hypothetical protein